MVLPSSVIWTLVPASGGLGKELAGDLLKFLRLDRMPENPTEGGGMWRLDFRQGQKGGQVQGVLAHPLSDAAEVILPRQFGEQHEHQDRYQTIAQPPRIPLIVQLAEGFKQTAQLEHAAVGAQVDFKSERSILGHGDLPFGDKWLVTAYPPYGRSLWSYCQGILQQPRFSDCSLLGEMDRTG
jgi:hypothetical protein